MDHPRSIPLQRPIEAKLWNEEERLIQDWYKSTLIIAKRNNGDQMPSDMHKWTKERWLYKGGGGKGEKE